MSVGCRVRNDRRAQLSRQASALTVAINLEPRFVALAIATRRRQRPNERRADGYNRRAELEVAPRLASPRESSEEQWPAGASNDALSREAGQWRGGAARSRRVAASLPQDANASLVHGPDGHWLDYVEMNNCTWAAPNKRMHRSAGSQSLIMVPMPVPAPGNAGRSAPAVARVNKEDPVISENGESWDKFIEALQEMEVSGELANEQRLRQFQIACCRYIWKVLPEIAREALQAAEQFAAGDLTASALVAERVALWDWLGKRSCDFSSPEVNAVRAVICCCYERLDLSVAYESAVNLVEFCEAALGEDIPHLELLGQAYRGGDDAK